MGKAVRQLEVSDTRLLARRGHQLNDFTLKLLAASVVQICTLVRHRRLLHIRTLKVLPNVKSVSARLRVGIFTLFLWLYKDTLVS